MVTEDAGDGTRRVSDLRSGENRHFGTQSTYGKVTAPSRPPGVDPLTPSWLYDDGVFGWGNNVLVRSTPCDLLVIDELGPLEILGDRGWFTAFDVLKRRQFGAALVVCRPALVDDLRDRIGVTRGTVYAVTPEIRDAMPAAILNDLLEVRCRSGR